MKKQFVIKKYQEYQEIIKKRNIKKSKNFTLYYSKNEFNYTRIGLLVGKRNGIAVKRNKIKRQVRTMIDESIDYSKSMNLIVSINSNYDTNKYFENKEELSNLLDSLQGAINE